MMNPVFFPLGSLPAIQAENSCFFLGRWAHFWVFLIFAQWALGLHDDYQMYSTVNCVPVFS